MQKLFTRHGGPGIGGKAPAVENLHRNIRIDLHRNIRIVSGGGLLDVCVCVGSRYRVGVDGSNATTAFVAIPPSSLLSVP